MSKDVGTIISLTFLAIILFLIFTHAYSAVQVIGGTANAALAAIHGLQTGEFVSATGSKSG